MLKDGKFGDLDLFMVSERVDPYQTSRETMLNDTGK